MFRIKICGITTVDDARVAAAAGADAIGLNFYRGSPRYVAPQQARQIADAVRGRLNLVGVFVGPSDAEVRAIAAEVGLQIVQLHGNEPAEMAARLSREVRVLKAFAIGPAGLAPVIEYLSQFRGLGGVLRTVLFDAHQPGQAGGTGKTADWNAIRASNYPSEGWHPPFVLAGGLTPENVAQGIRSLYPAGVDTASGVESSPGRKDPALVKRFVAAARAAFEQMPPADR